MRFRACLSGGLGNQMFQYAFAKSLSYHYKAELYIKTSGICGREYMLDKIFGISANDGCDIEWKNSIVESHNYTDGCESYYYNNLKNDNYDIIGYWQNEGYFKPYEELIRKEFNISSLRLSDRSLIMQVRRTDYVNNSHHFYCDVNWYKKALQEFTDFDLYIVTDDVEYCRSELAECNFKEIIIGDELKHLQVMKGSSMHIISNSTFGWWGAWLSNSDNVVCPAVWLPADINWETSRKNWKKLKR